MGSHIPSAFVIMNKYFLQEWLSESFQNIEGTHKKVGKTPMGNESEGLECL
jgi:hypothetical protein